MTEDPGKWRDALALFREFLDASNADADVEGDADSDADRDRLLEERLSQRPELRPLVERLRRADAAEAAAEEEAGDGKLGMFAPLGPAFDFAGERRESGSDPTGPDPTAPDAKGPDPTETVGPYRILERIGEGGMGVVFLAEQTEPVERKVALKWLRPYSGDVSFVRRFELEGRSLAQMEHPGIARFYDAGVSAGGQPYLAMEYVPGVPITEYCDARSLGLGERLSLFGDVCDAVQHAHQKGIIHRDVKPSNILVMEQDGRAVPKVIDLGIAKPTEATGAEGAEHTRTGQAIGTPAYMSPEQIGGQADIDTRTDVYSLGVLLYEMLVGSRPFEEEADGPAAWSELCRRIREVPPPRPSTRLGRSDPGAGRVADERRTTRVALRRRLRGDLDWIVMKAIEKDRERRYSSASELAADVRRALHDEPVIARPPKLAYRLGKFVRRNRVGVAATVVVAVSILGGTLGLALGLAQALAAKDLANERLGMATDAREEARLSESRALEIQNALTKILLAADPSVEGRPDTTLREVLDRTAATLGEELSDQPLVEAQIRLILSGAYRARGLYPEAVRQALVSLELFPESSLERAEILSYMAEIVHAGHDPDGLIERSALELGEEARDIRRDLLGPDHPATISIEGAISRFQKKGPLLPLPAFAWYGRSVPKDDPSFAAVRRMTASEIRAKLDATLEEIGEHFRAGRFEAASREIRHWTVTPFRGREPLHSFITHTLREVADHCFGLGKVAAAEAVYVECESIAAELYGPRDPRRIKAASDLGRFYTQTGRLRDATEATSRALDVSRQTQGKAHVETLALVDRLAERLLAERLEHCRAELPAGDPQVVLSRAMVEQPYRTSAELRAQIR